VSISHLFEVEVTLFMKPKLRRRSWYWTSPKLIGWVDQLLDRFIRSVNKAKFNKWLTGEEFEVA
jgi:hypothetical protein